MLDFDWCLKKDFLRSPEKRHQDNVICCNSDTMLKLLCKKPYIIVLLIQGLLTIHPGTINSKFRSNIFFRCIIVILFYKNLAS